MRTICWFFVANVALTACAAEKKPLESNKLDLGTPRLAVLCFNDAVSRRDWRCAEQCLASELRVLLKDAIADRTFFDQYVVYGFATKTLELLPANRVTQKGMAELARLESRDPPDAPPGGLPERFTHSVGSGGGECPWIAFCTFVKEKDGWKLTVDPQKMKNREDFRRWYGEAIPQGARGRAKRLEGKSAPIEQLEPPRGGPAPPPPVDY